MNETNRTSFLDMLFVLLMVFILLPHNPEVNKETEVEVKGNLIFEVTWEENHDVDVDLWIQAPGDKPVGYSRKNGKFLDLLRDDLGSRNDLGNLNYEVVFGRNAPSGEYIVNLHLFSNRSRLTQVPVELVVISDTKYSKKTRVFSAVETLEYEGQEITVIRFHYDTMEGRASRFAYRFKKLRSAGGN